MQHSLVGHMQKYTQLTCEQRYHVYLLNKQGHNQTFIAK
ncbi:hypothetical protein AZO1586I_819 [Bathymodiolus thermophilus thioautotrophic gill symbiont]|uniref:Uncharacterized protein n=2 Tax=sulfur-oxidizing symbionts TaxID=32036 RepID=A0ACA8ZRT1_9GAMM|nr:hypothetical protein AZO1586I_819 [Bathymodiolus thermophilus thioautotrophic gill symbiont]CAB5504867.1 hypothetical protein AZO1586R_1823 [Bathymodiolus azoricus thioautotrophic gill symbiont]CAC9526786.1 hypothetical protein [uncultured Gammaproteobacteria bacterium]